jgi:capsular exopolysaccharide synthesis family protein
MQRMYELSVAHRGGQSELGPERAITPLIAGEPHPPDIVHYLRILRRRRRLVAVISLSVLAVAALFTLLQTPTYRAETLLLIEPQAGLPQAIDVRGLQDGGAVAQPEVRDYYQTQFQILTSRSLASEVIEQEKLASVQFVPAGVLDRLGQLVPNLFGAAQSSQAAPAPAEPTDPVQSLAGAYQGQLAVTPVEGTGLVRLSFTTVDAELAARIVNAHAAAFVRHGIERYSRATEDARAFLATTLGELKQKMEESEQTLGAYRQREQILAGDRRADPILRRLETLSERWGVAEAERINLENQLNLIRSGRYELVPAIESNPAIGQLRAQLSEQEARDAMLTGELRTHSEEARRRLEAEIQRVIAGLESSYELARATEQDLRQRLQEQKAAALREQDLGAYYVVLEREAEANRTLYENVFQRLRSMELATKVQLSNVFVIDAAQPPLSLYAPQPLLNLSVALAAAIALSLGGVLIAEFLNARFRDPEEVQQYLGLANLGSVPDMRRLPRPVLRAQMTAVAAGGTPASAGAPGAALDPGLSTVALDAYRTIRTNLTFSRAGEPPRLILFSSAVASEGKTATAVNTAAMFAQAGARVLVIDADLRAPSCHSALHIEQSPGLTDVLTGAIDVQRVLQPTRHMVTTLAAGHLPPNPAELLGSEAMRSLLASLRTRYDHILIDAAPILGLPDTLPLATFVDGVVLVIDHHQTTRSQVRQAVYRLSFARAKLLGLVLNRVDFSELEAEGYPYVYPYRSARTA